MNFVKCKRYGWHKRSIAWVCSLEEHSLGSGCVMRSPRTVEKAVGRYVKEVNGGDETETVAAPARSSSHQSGRESYPLLDRPKMSIRT